MMKEIWKDIPEYNGRYSISNKGNVRSNYYKNSKRRNERLLKTYVDERGGYERVVLSENNKLKNYLVHRLVGEAFVSGKKDGLVINHIDYNRANNVSSNLEWVTVEENVHHSQEHLRVPKKNRAPGKTGNKYISFTKNNTYRLHVRINDVDFDRRFKSLKEALNARKRVIGW